MKTQLLSSIVLTMLLSGIRAHSQQVTLYDNHFESPNIPPTSNCGPDLDATDLNTLWSGTAGGTGGGGSFQQVNTVETILIHGPFAQYSDPEAIGGNYCISMLSSAQDDKAALTLNSQLLPYAIISMDISAIDIASCGGPFGVDTPIVDIKIYDSPGGSFSFYLPGTLLDHDTLIGNAPGATIYTFNWSSQLASMDISGSTDGNITVVFDLLRSGYAAIDNLLILSSISSVNQVSSSNNYISVLPNPAYDQITIVGLSGLSTDIIIADVCGRVVKSVHNNHDRPLNIADLPAGTYFLMVNGREFFHTAKFITM